MKHLLVIALAPKGEDFDASTFITNEAAWISTSHLDAIEAALGKSDNESHRCANKPRMSCYGPEKSRG